MAGPPAAPGSAPPARRAGRTRRTVLRRATACGAIALALALAAAGCNRRPRFVPPAADSTLAAPRDSLAEQVRVLRERWGAEGAGEEAARLTAELLLADLRAQRAIAPRASWEERARALLDSIDVGAELAGAPCVLAVNFFARGDPASGSWPWLYWCDGAGIQAQAVEGQGLGLVAAASRGLEGGPAAATGPPAIAGLFARRGAAGQQPLLLSWRVAGRQLEVAQTLGPDSLGGVGNGGFETSADSGVVLATRTWQIAPRFEECATCPHVIHLRRFAWGPDRFQAVGDRIVATPYVVFVQLVQALTAGDADAAAQCVTRPGLVEAARRAGWAAVRGPWRAAPGSEERGDEMVFYRGSSEAWRVRFERRGDEWRVAAFETTTRVIE